MRIDNKQLYALALAGKTASEIAVALDLTEKQVYNGLYRLRKKGIDIPPLSRPVSGIVEIATQAQGYCHVVSRQRKNLTPFSIRISEDILARLKGTALRLGISQAEVIEDALCSWWTK